MFTEAELLRLADGNLAEFAREHARWLPPTRIEEHADLLLTACGSRFPAGVWNCALPLSAGSLTTDSASEALERAQHFFGGLARRFSMYARAHRDAALARLCESQGWARLADTPGMVLAQPIAEPPLPAGLRVQRVESEDDARDFVQIMASAYERMLLPAAVTTKLFAQPQRWLAPHCVALTLCDDGKARAGALALFSHGIAGIYWVGTAPDAERRGYARTLVRALGNLAFERGARAVILQASPYGEPVYRRLGYREFTRYALYLSPER